MGAWKLRALVYGMLAVVAALVLLARAEHDSSAEVPPALQLAGRTAQGGPVNVELRHGQLVSWSVDGLVASCYNDARRTWHWSGTPYGARGTYFLRRGAFDVHVDYKSATVWMHARVERGRVSGSFDMTERYPHGTCTSGPVAFSAVRW